MTAARHSNGGTPGLRTMLPDSHALASDEHGAPHTQFGVSA